MTLASNQTSPSRRKGGAFAEPRLGPAAAARSERSLARRVAASTAENRPARRPRPLVRASPRPSACGGDIIERGIGKLVPLRRNAITSDVVTRLWQGDPARQSASVRERQVDVMNLHHRQLIEAALIGLEAIGRTEAHSEIAMKYQPKRFPTVVAPHRFRMR